MVRQHEAFPEVEDGGMSLDFDLEPPSDHQAQRGASSSRETPQADPLPSRPFRQRRLPRRFLDAAPDLSDEDGVELRPPAQAPLDSQQGRFHVFQTNSNRFGLWKVFKRMESAEGGTSISEDRWCRGAQNQEEAEGNPTDGRLGPFPNESTYRLFQWFYSGSHTMSLEQLIKLQDVVSSSCFSPEDLRGVDLKGLAKQLGNARLDDFFDSRDGWIEQSLGIDVPLGHLGKEVPLKAEFTVNKFFYRPLLGVICNVFESRARSAGFVYEPYEVKFKSPYGGQEMNVYGELYWSRKFRDAHEEVQLLPREAGDNFPRAVVALQIWSDGMCAAKFGNAKLWPAYLQFGNQSKYERSKPGMCHHIAHIPSVCTSEFL